MGFKRIRLALTIVACFVLTRASAGNDGAKFTKLVDSLYQRMSVEERTAQLCGVRPGVLMKDGKLSLEKCRRYIPNGVGHICQFACSQDMMPEELRAFEQDLQSYLIKETPSGIPAVFHEEAISGFAAKGATVYPQQIGVACTWNTELAQLKTRQTAEAMRSVGSTMALSPMVDIIRTPHWSRVEESYGEDPFLAASMGCAFVKGLQGGDLSKGVAACTKHFLGYGGGNALSWKEIMEEVLYPHEQAIHQCGSQAVMMSYGKFRSEQAVASDTLLHNLLHGYLGFNGLVVSDYGAVRFLGKTEEQKKKAAEFAFNAGNDMDFPSGDCYKYLPELLREGKVSEERFEQAVKRALLLKARLGLLDKEFKEKQNTDSALDLDPPSWRQTAYQLACQSVVMLRNNGVLPLKAGTKKRIALVGPNANTFWSMLGDYTYQSGMFFWWGGEIDPAQPRIPTLREALDERLENVCYERGCDWSSADEAAVMREGDPRTQRLQMSLMKSSDPTDWNKAVKVAESSDVVIAALGENPTLCGEARSRKGIRLPGDQEKFLRELVSTGRPVILVMFGGRPMALGSLADSCAAVLHAWYPGEEGANAVADILVGNVSPSGKLCISYPRTEKQQQYCYNYGKSSPDIAYPFGYGLSYTRFEYSALTVPEKVSAGDREINVNCTVTNVGDSDGAEVVQLYVSPLSGQPLKPVQLKAFSRVELKKGESRKVTLRVTPEQLSYIENGRRTVAKGNYRFTVGGASDDRRLSAECVMGD